MIQWEWDAAKAASNLHKHGVAFEAAALALDDPFSLTVDDPHDDGNRERTTAAAAVNIHAVLLVVHTVPAVLNGVLVGRIISARRASKTERVIYERRRR